MDGNDGKGGGGYFIDFDSPICKLESTPGLYRFSDPAPHRCYVLPLSPPFCEVQTPPYTDKAMGGGCGKESNFNKIPLND